MDTRTPIIRIATTEDIDAIYEISCAVHQSAVYRELIPQQNYEAFVAFYKHTESNRRRYRAKILRYMSDNEWFIWVAELDQKIVGFTMAQQTKDYLKLRGLFIQEEYQGLGLGKQLFNVSCAIVKPNQQTYFYVMEKNARAIGMYLKAGFEFVSGSDEPFYGTKLIKMIKNCS